jgi:hypothetical protein
LLAATLARSRAHAPHPPGELLLGVALQAPGAPGGAAARDGAGGASANACAPASDNDAAGQATPPGTPAPEASELARQLAWIRATRTVLLAGAFCAFVPIVCADRLCRC